VKGLTLSACRRGADNVKEGVGERGGPAVAVEPSMVSRYDKGEVIH
jgi:hypothetical protein